MQYILCVDDEIELCEFLAEELAASGLKGLSAYSGNHAKNVLTEGPKKGRDIVAVVTDIRMPDGNGIELLDWIFSTMQNPPKVFMVSGYSDVPTEDLLAKGATAVFAKPIDYDVVIAHIRRTINPEK